MRPDEADTDDLSALDTAMIDQVVAQARADGALLEIETEQEWLEDKGIPFVVRWIASLASKDATRVNAAGDRRAGFNPFLPPDPKLCIGDLGPDHRVVLNKYPVIQRHLLIVTRRFEAQTAPLHESDFRALALTLARLGGLGFYNGGSEAGASQPHKHLQWIPAAPDGAGLTRFTQALAASPTLEPVRRAGLPWRHAFVRHAGTRGVNAEHLQQAFLHACEATGMPAAADPMPPYNLLADSQWLLLVPRIQEQHEGISINSLGYAGSLFVRRPEQIDLVRRIGPLQLLAAVAA
jgi:ATP adenylyltransferase